MAIRIRYSLRTLLIVFSVFACLFTVYHFYARLTAAQEHFRYQEVQFEVRNICLLELCVASEELLGIECSTPWVRSRQAKMRHQECVGRALAYYQGGSSDLLMGVGADDVSSPEYKRWLHDYKKIQLMYAELGVGDGKAEVGIGLGPDF